MKAFHMPAESMRAIPLPASDQVGLFHRSSPLGASPTAHPADAPDMACPQCWTGLTAIAIAEQAALRCENCRGVVMATEAFTEVVHQRWKNALAHGQHSPSVDAEDFVRILKCPRCGHCMKPRAGADVVDACPRCDLVWLDHRDRSRLEQA
jgi:Zn-finger nucleic acid-binding protein